MEKIEFTRINNDVYGNPRYVCHFLNLVNELDSENCKVLSKSILPFQMPIEHAYRLALKKAKKIGGRKFHNKQYGGGIVFQSYNIGDTEKSIIDANKLTPEQMRKLLLNPLSI